MHPVFLVARPEPGFAIEAALAAGPDVLVIEAAGDAASEAARLIPDLRRRSTSCSLYARISPLAADRADRELDALMACAPDGILLPGAVGMADVEHLGVKLALREALLDRPDGTTRIVASLADSARGVFALPTLPSGASPRLAGIACDPARLAREIGCRIGAPAIVQAAAMTVLAARRADLPAIMIADGPPGAAERCFQAWRSDGFDALILSDAALVAPARAAVSDLPRGA